MHTRTHNSVHLTSGDMVLQMHASLFFVCVRVCVCVCVCAASDLCIGSNVSSDSLATVKDAFKFFIKADYRCTLEIVGVLSGGAIVLCVLALLCACAVCCCIRRRARRGTQVSGQ